jgi:hypothetical protein
MRWVGYVAHMGDMRNTYNFRLEYLYARDHLEDLGINGKITLQYILNRQGGKLWTQSFGL